MVGTNKEQFKVSYSKAILWNIGALINQHTTLKLCFPDTSLLWLVNKSLIDRNKGTLKKHVHIRNKKKKLTLQTIQDE